MEQKVRSYFDGADFKKKTSNYIAEYKDDPVRGQWLLEMDLREDGIASPDNIKWNKTTIAMEYDRGNDVTVTATISTRSKSLISDPVESKDVDQSERQSDNTENESADQTAE